MPYIPRPMRLTSLDIKNFRVLKKASLVFPDAVIGIHGPNGAGKSSLVESVAWALYGTAAARSGRDEVKSGFVPPTDNCEVALTFNVRGDNYRVERRLIGKSDRAEVKLFRGERSESVGVTDTQAAIEQLIGLDWLGFRTSFLARQSELSAFTDVVASRRREHLTRMLGIERLDGAIKHVRVDARTAEEKAAVVGRQLAEKSMLLADMESIELKLVQARSEAESSRINLDAASKNLESTETEYVSMVAKHVRFKELSAQSKAAIEKLDSISNRLAELTKERTKLEELTERASKLQKDTADYEVAQSELNRLKSMREKSVLSASLRNRIDQLAADAEKRRGRLHDLEIGLVGNKERILNLPPGLPSLISDREKRLASLRDELSNVRAKKAHSEKEAAKLTEKLGSIESLGPNSECDRCRRPLGNDFAAIRAHFESDLNAISEDIIKMSGQETTVVARGLEEKKVLDALVVQLEEVRKLEVAVSSAEKEQAQVTADLTNLMSQIESAQKELDSVGDATFDEKCLAEMELAVTSMEQGRRELDNLKGQLVRREEVSRQIETQSSEKSIAEENVKILGQSLGELGFNEALFRQSESRRNEAVKLKEDALFKDNSINSIIQVLDTDQRGKREALNRLDRLAEERETYLDAQHYLQKLSSVFSDFREGLIAQIRPTLGELSSRLYAEVTGGRYALIELDEEYEMRIMDSSQFYGIKRFSGGEKDLANLCLRLAISLSISMSAGLERGFIILDEVFGSQDSERKELILKAMVNLRERFPQIFLITHTEEIRDKVEQLIEVRPSRNGHSEVVVNGVLVS